MEIREFGVIYRLPVCVKQLKKSRLVQYELASDFIVRALLSSDRRVVLGLGGYFSLLVSQGQLLPKCLRKTLLQDIGGGPFSTLMSAFGLIETGSNK